VIVVGELALWVALFLAVWGTVASFGGATSDRPELVDSAVRSIFAGAAMIALACLGLWAALVGHDFSLRYVEAHTTLNTPTLYLITAAWAGRPGAILSFALAVSACSAYALSPRRRPSYQQLPWVVGALAAVIALALSAACFVANPYDRVEWVAADGHGLDPRLQNPLALPFYLAAIAGCGAAAIPFALALGAAITQNVDVDWLSSVRRWAVVTWALLTISNALRMRWAYLEPVAGGLLPTDVAAAALLGGWMLGFWLLRSFAVRAGRPSPRSAGALAIVLFCFAAVGAAAPPQAPGSTGPSARAPAAVVLALSGLAIVAAGAVYAAAKRVPTAAAGGLATRRRAIAELGVYVGVLTLLVGLTATRWWTEREFRLRPGEAQELTDPYRRRWRFVSQGVSRDERMNYLSTGVALETWRGGEGAGIIGAERRQYLDSVQRMTYEPTLVPGVRSWPELDLYVVLAEVRGDTAQLRVAFRPFVACVWVGWLVIAAGGLTLGLRRSRAEVGGAARSRAVA
jgi:cytochrome c biogenesis factor